MTQSQKILLAAATVFGTTLPAQTTGVVGVNDFVINGTGSGGTSLVHHTLLAGPQLVTFEVTASPGAFVVLAAGDPALGSAAIPNGTTLDIDLSVGVFYDGSGTLAPEPVFPFGFTTVAGAWQLGFAIGLMPLEVSVQAAVVDPSHAGGASLCQAHTILVDATPPANPVYLSTIGGDLSPLGDDSFINLAFANSVGFTFYGVTYHDVWVNMNGNLTFTAGDSDFTPSSSEMLSEEPRIAPLWDDWTPDDPNQGTVRVFNTPTSFQVEWFDVPHFGDCASMGDSNTFGARLDFPEYSISLRHDVTLLCAPPFGSIASTDQIIGVSPGQGLSSAASVDLSTAPAPSATGDAMFQDLSLTGPFDFGVSSAGPRAHEGIYFDTGGGVGVVATILY